MTTGDLDFLYVLMVAGAAAESVTKERERDTWLGLIATPLTGREILRAKLLGSIWRTRGLAVLMHVLWIVGLLAGAVHPLGFLAAVTGMGVSCWFLAALGLSASLWSRDRAQATGRALGPLVLIARAPNGWVAPESCAGWPGSEPALPAQPPEAHAPASGGSGLRPPIPATRYPAQRKGSAL